MTVNETEEIFLADSNILIYNYDTSDMDKHNTAKSILDKCWKGEKRLAVSAQNLSELFSVTTRKGFITKKEIMTDISNIIDFPDWMKLDFNHKTVLDACRISEEHSMSYWDSLLAATMRQNSVLNLYTENAKDFKMPWLNVVNPFEK